jgi:hypothetical protein
MAAIVLKNFVDDFGVMSAEWGRNKYYLSPCYRGRDNKLYPIRGLVKQSKKEGCFDVPFFYDVKKFFTIKADQLVTGVVKEFEHSREKRLCQIVIAEVCEDITPELFKILVEKDIESFLTRKSQA